MDFELSNISEEDLKKELQRRKDERFQQALAVRDKKIEHWMKHLDAILALVPEHSRTYFSDTNLNGRDCCARCKLLEFKQGAYWDKDYIVDINIYSDPIRREVN